MSGYPKKLLLLGATGSIGTQTLEVLRSLKKFFCLEGISVFGRKKPKITEILQEFSPRYLHIHDAKVAQKFQKKFPKTHVFSGDEGLFEMMSISKYEHCLNALPGSRGLLPSMKVVKEGKTLLLSNKESLVISGKLLVKTAKKTGARILPVDSEITALWFLLKHRKISHVEKVFLPCSGGPFFDAKKWPISKLRNVTPDQALRHPRWKMGEKITIDSATLMNKAFEMIEIVRLFGIPHEKIEVVIHPEAILHAAVQFSDGQIVAHLGNPDMKETIAMILSEALGVHKDSPEKLYLNGMKLTFFPPDEKRFPSLELARNALKKGEKACAELCKRNDEAVEKFLSKEIGFLEIFERL
ncbi:1-deoxy-D-xylulose-5-phosphate reductoisomerase [Candidatus Peregrinibacteria bacterium]|nr:1-deoxy-D-xylulose-5-phosphate reductoisomerase [Candidatus Peregrinibacteria bacterium]